MKKTIFLTIAALSVLSVCGGHRGLSPGSDPARIRIQRFYPAGVGYLSYKSNMVASIQGFDLSKERNDSLNDSPDSETTALVTLPFALAYTFASTRTQLFFGTDLTDLIRFTDKSVFKQGIGQPRCSAGRFSVHGMPAEVWESPISYGQDRDDTKRKSTGARLTWDRIFGSFFQVQYTIARWTSTLKQAGNPWSGG